MLKGTKKIVSMKLVKFSLNRGSFKIIGYQYNLSFDYIFVPVLCALGNFRGGVTSQILNSLLLHQFSSFVGDGV